MSRDGGLQQLRHGGGNLHEVFDEALVKPTNAKEGSDVFGALGCGPVGDCLHLLWLFFDARRGNNKTAKVDAWHREKAFGPFCEEFFGAKLVQDQGEVALMVGFGRGVVDNVVDVDGAEGRELLGREVHCPLESGGGVAEAKRHAAEFGTIRSGFGRRCVHGALRRPGSGGSQT